MSEMIERVARAIEPFEFEMRDQRYAYEMARSGDHSEATAFAEEFFSREKIFAKARAAIDAMREPTKEMVTKGAQAGPWTIDRYAAIINAALKEA